MRRPLPSRRDALKIALGGALTASGVARAAAPAAATVPATRAADDAFRLNYVLSSALYGTMPLDVVLPEVRRAGADAIDVWCKPHGNQREQVDEIGADAFAAMLKKHDLRLASFTRYPLGAFGLGDEMKVAAALGATTLVTGTGGPKDPAGPAAVTEMRAFLEKMKPHADAAGALGLRIALENHASALLSHPDSLRAFADLNRSPALGVAFAPHHLHAWADQIPKLIEDVGPHLAFFYAQEHGRGFLEKLPKDEEMMQLPGRGGGLDYRPVVAALKKVKYRGPVEIFMHPTPRGVPILPTAPEITAAVNQSRAYLERCCRET